ncbi:MAG: hypothetical protein WCI20_10010 [bacterium]
MDLSHQNGAASVSNSVLVKRLLELTWRYREGCLKVLGFQISLLALGLCGLGLTGLGIDFIRHEIQPATRAPLWPFHLAPPTPLVADIRGGGYLRGNSSDGGTPGLVHILLLP